jgi:hypothetical protein
LLTCSKSIEIVKTNNELPRIFPDYIGVTIPPNIAPLNFRLIEDTSKNQAAIFEANSIKFEVRAKNGQFQIPELRWKELLKASIDNEFVVTVCIQEGTGWTAYSSFKIKVAKETVDPFVVYRLIEPGYEIWNEMGIYQRELSTYSESTIMDNRMTDNNCMNCHSFPTQNPDKMLFHMRDKNAGTYLIDGDKIEKLNTKTDQTISALVYPSWHPSGRFVAFSTNTTNQNTHKNDPNRIEVYDSASDVVVYDTEKHEIVSSALLTSEGAFETFPTFSPDGKTLYFCSALARSIPREYADSKYSLCAISFDPDTRSFGAVVDTLYNAEIEGNRSVSFPRVSPDGKYLLYTLSGYGTFSIWHKDADLYMLNLSTGEHYPLTQANSTDTESYHSWSSNSRWIVFSSRRVDGLYTRPYFAYIDENGQAAKPFLLPQKNTEFYQQFMKSYNIPEFITGKVKSQVRKIAVTAKEDPGTNVKYAPF